MENSFELTITAAMKTCVATATASRLRIIWVVWQCPAISFGARMIYSHHQRLFLSPITVFFSTYKHSSQRNQQDVQWLSGQLGNLQSSVRVDWAQFNHLDFLWGVNNNRLIYDPLMAVLPSPWNVTQILIIILTMRKSNHDCYHRLVFKSKKSMNYLFLYFRL